MALSTGSFPFPVPILPLQVKNITRPGEIGLDFFIRSDWTLTGKLSPVYNSAASVGLIDSSLLGILTTQSLSNLTYTDGKIRFGSRCITAMQCLGDHSDHPRCDVNANKPIQSLDELERGTYLRLMNCSARDDIAQRMTRIEHNCTLAKLTNLECDPGCNQAFFGYDRGACRSRAPSSTPSSAPSRGPSSGPSSGPSFNPSSAPSSTPSSAPSFAPSSAPSFAPSQELGFQLEPAIITLTPTASTETPASTSNLTYILIVLPVIAVGGFIALTFFT